MKRSRTAIWLPATCRRCGKAFEYKPISTMGVYCSHACRFDQVEKQCPQCKRAFSVRRSKTAKYTFCSIACKLAANADLEMECETCHKRFTVARNRLGLRRFCSKECSYAGGRLTIICAFCGNECVKKRHLALGGARCCSNRCATLLRMGEGWNPGWMAEKLRSGYRTDIEGMAEQALIELGIPYLFEHKCGRYLIDFALPTLGIALECDGWQHATDKGRAKDVVRDAALAGEGWRVIHLKDSLIRHDALAIVRDALIPYFER